MGVLTKSEATTEEMIDIMHHIQNYVPQSSDGQLLPLFWWRPAHTWKGISSSGCKITVYRSKRSSHWCNIKGGGLAHSCGLLSRRYTSMKGGGSWARGGNYLPYCHPEITINVFNNQSSLQQIPLVTRAPWNNYKSLLINKIFQRKSKMILMRLEIYWCCCRCTHNGCCSDLFRYGIYQINSNKNINIAAVESLPLKERQHRLLQAVGNLVSKYVLHHVHTDVARPSSTHDQTLIPEEAVSDLITKEEDHKLNYATAVLRMGLLARNFHDSSK